MEAACAARVRVAKDEAQAARGELDRLQKRIATEEWRDEYADMVREVAEDAARRAAGAISERIASAFEDVLIAVHQRLTKRGEG